MIYFPNKFILFLSFLLIDICDKYILHIIKIKKKKKEAEQKSLCICKNVLYA